MLRNRPRRTFQVSHQALHLSNFPGRSYSNDTAVRGPYGAENFNWMVNHFGQGESLKASRPRLKLLQSYANLRGGELGAEHPAPICPRCRRFQSGPDPPRRSLETCRR
jgi:hypothetical protein